MEQSKVKVTRVYKNGEPHLEPYDKLDAEFGVSFFEIDAKHYAKYRAHMRQHSRWQRAIRDLGHPICYFVGK